MPATIKQYDRKLRSLNNTHKMTKTMKLVSMSKLYKAQDRQRRAKFYAAELKRLTAQAIHALGGRLTHPLVGSDGSSRNTLIIVLTSDRGLCGGYNHRLIKAVRQWLDERNDQLDRCTIAAMGRQALSGLKDAPAVLQDWGASPQDPDFAQAQHYAERCLHGFLNDQWDAVVLAHNRYVSPLVQEPIIEQLLPLVAREIVVEPPDPFSDYLFEPEPAELMDVLLPRYVSFRVYFALLENNAGEHGARMTAMDNATTNAEKLIETTTLARNRARQAAITTELIEIISGAEALNAS